MTSSLESKTVALEGQLWTEYLPNNSTVSLPGPVLVLGVKHAEEVGWGLGLHHLVHQQHRVVDHQLLNTQPSTLSNEDDKCT